MKIDITQMKEDVNGLMVTGHRVTGSKGNAEARNYLLSRLQTLNVEKYAAAGCSAYEWPYQGNGCEMVNVIGWLPGPYPDRKPVLVAAHYDTWWECPGADDNAAAIAILLNIIPALQNASLERPVIVAFFDAEEPPFFLTPAMGSIYFHEHQCVSPVHCAIVMDLCGHDVPVQGLEDLLFITGIESDPALQQTVRSCAPKEKLRTVPLRNDYIGDLSDHHIFRVHEEPYLFLSCGRWEHYHHATDTPDVLNFEKMAAIANYLYALVVDVSSREMKGPFDGVDTLETELLFLREAVGPFLELLGITPRTRDDLDMLVNMVVTQMGL